MEVAPASHQHSQTCRQGGQAPAKTAIYGLTPEPMGTTIHYSASSVSSVFCCFFSGAGSGVLSLSGQLQQMMYNKYVQYKSPPSCWICSISSSSQMILLAVSETFLAVEPAAIAKASLKLVWNIFLSPATSASPKNSELLFWRGMASDKDPGRSRHVPARSEPIHMPVGAFWSFGFGLLACQVSCCSTSVAIWNSTNEEIDNTL